MASGIVESSNQGQQNEGQQGEQGTPGTQRSRLVQRLLAATANLPQFINDLLHTQAMMVAGTEAAGFVVERKDSAVNLRAIAHFRPDNSDAATRQAAINAFVEILKPCVQQGKDGAIEINAGDGHPEPQYCLVTLLRNEGQIVAATTVITRCRNLERAQQRLMSMTLVAGYFDLFTLRRQSEEAQVVAQSHQHVLQLATAVATAEGFESAAMNLCNELATRTGASRVTLGWLKGNTIKVRAFSHTEQFDKKQELVVQLEKVMEECVDQEEAVQFDPDGSGTPNVSRAAGILSRSQGGNTVLTLPLRKRAEVVGAVTLEFPAAHKLGAQASTGLAVAVDLLAPQLYDRWQNDRYLITKAGLSTRDMTAKLVGPQHMLGKLIALGVLGLVLFISLYKPMYHVTAPFQFQATDRRTLDAPFDGIIKKGGVHVRPGDRVKAGQLLLQMDDSDLIPKRSEAYASYQKDLAESRKAAADPTKQADADIARKAAEADLAEVHLYDRQLELAQVKAPFDGVVLSGDLTDKEGTPVKQGDQLFLVSGEQGGLRAELAVSEADVQDLKIGQTGKLATTSLPSAKYPFTIDRIIPLGEVKDPGTAFAENRFTVYAHLDQSSSLWSPGIAGEAKIDVAKHRLVWIWTHKAIDWLRLRAWTYGL